MCAKGVCVWLGVVYELRGEWIRGLGLGCGGVAGVVREWVGLGPWLLFAFQSASSQYGCPASR